MARAQLAGAAALVIAALALGADRSAPAHPQTAQSAAREQVVLDEGDTMRVAGTRLGCQIGRRDGRLAIECRRLGRLARTYMTVLTERNAKIARFRSQDTAKVIFTARHGGGARACEAMARMAATCE